MLITNLNNPLLLKSSNITYSSVKHEATRRIGEHVSTNVIKVNDTLYVAVYYKDKLIATRASGDVDWVKTILDGENVAIPKFFKTF